MSQFRTKNKSGYNRKKSRYNLKWIYISKIYRWELFKLESILVDLSKIQGKCLKWQKNEIYMFLILKLIEGPLKFHSWVSFYFLRFNAKDGQITTNWLKNVREFIMNISEINNNPQWFPKSKNTRFLHLCIREYIKDLELEQTFWLHSPSGLVFYLIE